MDKNIYRADVIVRATKDLKGNFKFSNIPRANDNMPAVLPHW